MTRGLFAWHHISFPFPEGAGSLTGVAIRYLGDPRRRDFVENALGMPKDIERATVKRQRDYLAGRISARCALERLDPRAASRALGRHPDGRADWPPGIVGSISHCDDIAVAVTAKAANHPVIGVDVQRLFRAEQSATLRRKIAPEYMDAPVGWKEQDFVTLAFSAKESLFKALFADVGKVFGFDAEVLTTVDRDRRFFELRLTRTLAEQWIEGADFVGRYYVANRWLMTAVGF